MSRAVRVKLPPYRLIELWDGRTVAARTYCGMPVFGYQRAPLGLVTQRQLRQLGFCPGGQEPYAQLWWRRGRRWAHLYRLDLARPKRVPSPAQLAALEKALAARRARETCPDCDEHVGYRIDPGLGRCYACDEARDVVDVRDARASWASERFDVVREVA